MLNYIEPLIIARKNRQISDHIHLGFFGCDRDQLNLAQAQDAMSLHHIQYIDLARDQTIVDVGCGFGGTLRLLDGYLNSLYLYGVNIDMRQIELAKLLKLQNQIKWLNCDAARFSQDRSDWADYILCIEALFHFPDPIGFFKATAQALHNNGQLIMSTLVLKQPDDALQRSIKCVCNAYAPWPFPQMSVNNIVKMAEDTGLRLVHYEDLSDNCLPSLNWMSPECPEAVTNTPVIEFRRLFEAGWVSYPMFIFEKS